MTRCGISIFVSSLHPFPRSLLSRHSESYHKQPFQYVHVHNTKLKNRQSSPSTTMAHTLFHYHCHRQEIPLSAPTSAELWRLVRVCRLRRNSAGTASPLHSRYTSPATHRQQSNPILPQLRNDSDLLSDVEREGHDPDAAPYEPVTFKSIASLAPPSPHSRRFLPRSGCVNLVMRPAKTQQSKLFPTTPFHGDLRGADR